MQAFQKQAEAHLAQIGTGLVVRPLPTIIAPGYWISAMAVWAPASSTAMAVVFVVFGLLTSERKRTD